MMPCFSPRLSSEEAHMKWLGALVLATLVSCGGVVVTTGGDTLYDDGAQGAAGCPIASTWGGQPGVPGDPCSSAAADCSPACCECASDTDSYWASECSGGVCLSDADACADAFNSDGALCTN